jgi:hypothetical protein
MHACCECVRDPACAQQVDTVRDHPFVFFLDGVDELGQKIDLYTACNLGQWTRSTVIFGARTGFLQVRPS